MGELYRAGCDGTNAMVDWHSCHCPSDAGRPIVALPQLHWRSAMKRFVIERNLPGVQNMAAGELSDAAAQSNAAIAKFPGKLTWEHSYVVNDKTFCIYLADSEQTVLAHAKES